MAMYEVIGKDTQTNKPAKIMLSATSVTDAAIMAGQRGIEVDSVESARGDIYTPDGAGGFRKHTMVKGVTTKDADNTEASLFVWSVLIPLVGIIAGANRLARDDQRGSTPLFAALIGSVLWLVLVARQSDII